MKKFFQTGVEMEESSAPHPGFIVAFPEMSLTLEEVWPDGDAPKNPTAEDVIKRMKETAGTPANCVKEWLLVDDLVVWNNADEDDIGCGWTEHEPD